MAGVALLAYVGWQLFGTTAPQYVTWTLGTVVGVFAGGLIGDPHDFGLDALFPAFFLALLIAELKDRRSRTVAAAGAAIALALGRSEAAVRQLAGRAKAHVREARPRYTVDKTEAERLAKAFLAASATGDAAAFAAILAQDAIMVSDGGGKRKAALRVLVGRDDIIRLLQGLKWRHGAPLFERFEMVRINGAPGLVLDPVPQRRMVGDLSRGQEDAE